jgi:hypothetical protein
LVSRRSFARRAASFLAVITASATWIVASAGPAAAHETRRVGDYVFVVGFAEEPAYAGEPNGVELTISDARTEEPFVELGDTLEVEVMFGDESLEMTMEPAFVVDVFGEPGQYTADFVPSRPGQYIFHFVGQVGQQDVDETFESGPETFDDVNDPAEFMFPVQDPSVGELAELVENEVARLQEANAQLEQQVAQLSGSSDSSEGSSNDTLILVLAIAGLGLGAIALVVAVMAGSRRRA